MGVLIGAFLSENAPPNGPPSVSPNRFFLFSVVLVFYGVFAGNKKAAKCRFVWLFLRCKNISRI
jgi:hypothetical protein